MLILSSIHSESIGTSFKSTESDLALFLHKWMNNTGLIILVTVRTAAISYHDVKKGETLNRQK